MDLARARLGAEAREAAVEHKLYEILYADDTIIIGVDHSHVQELATAIGHAGSHFGMTLHWGKTQTMAVRLETNAATAG